MKPASTTRSAPSASSRPARAASKAARPSNDACGSASAGRPRPRASASPGADSRLAITAATRAGQCSSAQARARLAMFEPWPEIRITRVFTGRQRGEGSESSIATPPGFGRIAL